MFFRLKKLRIPRSLKYPVPVTIQNKLTVFHIVPIRIIMPNYYQHIFFILTFD